MSELTPKKGFYSATTAILIVAICGFWTQKLELQFMYRTREHRAKEMYFSKTKVFNDIQRLQTEDMLKKRMFCNFLTLWIMKIRHCPGRCRDRRESVGGNQRRKTLTPNMKRHKGKVSKKRFHLGKLFQIWVGDPKPTKSTRKSPFLTRISPFVFPNLTKTLGWAVGSKILESCFPKKSDFLRGGLPYLTRKTKQWFLWQGRLLTWQSSLTIS